MNIKKNIPNAITCCNLLCGCLAIVQAMNGNLVWAAYLVGMAAIFDFFDGFAARLLKVSSPIGKDLDSLADMVTFGVVPGIVMFQLLRYSFNHLIFMPVLLTSQFKPEPFSIKTALPYIAFLIPIFSAIRLAKFNNDPRQSDSFIGVPTPANAILICSLALLMPVIDAPAEAGWTIYPPLSAIQNESRTADAGIPFFIMEIFTPAVLIPLTAILSFLLVAELPLFALKFKHFKWKGNEIRFSFLILCIAMLATLRLAGIPLCIVLYVLMSVINNLITKRRGTVAG